MPNNCLNCSHVNRRDFEKYTHPTDNPSSPVNFKQHHKPQSSCYIPVWNSPQDTRDPDDISSRWPSFWQCWCRSLTCSYPVDSDQGSRLSPGTEILHTPWSTVQLYQLGAHMTQKMVRHHKRSGGHNHTGRGTRCNFLLGTWLKNIESEPIFSRNIKRDNLFQFGYFWWVFFINGNLGVIRFWNE